MKKLYTLLVLALGIASCQTEPEGLDVVVGGEQDVVLNVSLLEDTFENCCTYPKNYCLFFSVELTNCKGTIFVLKNRCFWIGFLL